MTQQNMPDLIGKFTEALLRIRTAATDEEAKTAAREVAMLILVPLVASERTTIQQAPSEFARLVKRHLYDRGLTQDWLAAQIGVAPASLSRVMRGKRSPRETLVLAINSKLELTPDEGVQLLAAARQERRGTNVPP